MAWVYATPRSGQPRAPLAHSTSFRLAAPISDGSTSLLEARSIIAAFSASWESPANSDVVSVTPRLGGEGVAVAARGPTVVGVISGRSGIGVPCDRVVPVGKGVRVSVGTPSGDSVASVVGERGTPELGVGLPVGLGRDVRVTSGLGGLAGVWVAPGLDGDTGVVGSEGLGALSDTSHAAPTSAKAAAVSAMRRRMRPLMMRLSRMAARRATLWSTDKRSVDKSPLDGRI